MSGLTLMGNVSPFQKTEVESTEERQPPSQYNIEELDRIQFTSCNTSNGKRRKCSNHWQAVPDDVMEKILQRLKLKDRIRLRAVCKSWESIVMRRDICSAPHEAPWLVLHPQLKDPSRSDNCLSFLSLSDAKLHKLMLPTPPEGATNWIHGSTKGWLIMIREYLGLDCDMFLLNPISKVQHRLPSFNTIGDFSSFKVGEGRLRSAALDFLNKLELSTSDVSSEHCMVAAVFKDYSTLALCRPGDERWTILLELPGFETKNYFDDILFSSGALHACVCCTPKDKEDKDKEMVVEARTLKFGDRVMGLKLVHFVDYRLGRYLPRLLESNNEVFFVIQIIEDPLGDGDVEEYGYHGEDNEHYNDIEGDVHGEYHVDQANAVGEEDNENINNIEGSDQDGEFYGDEEYPDLLWRTCCFKVYKLNPKNDIFVRVKCLVDKTLLFADRGYLSTSAKDIKELEGNRIYFATKTYVHRKYRQPVVLSHDIGVFNLESGRTEKNIPSIDMSVWSRLEGLLEMDVMRFIWFTPRMC